MATPTLIGKNTWEIRISDVITDATDPGFWSWWIKGKIEPETWDFTPLVDLEVSNDNNLGTMTGRFRWSAVVRNVEIKTKADMDNLKKALRYWNDNNSLLYFDHYIGGVDEGYVSNSTWNGLIKIRLRGLKMIWSEQKKSGRIGTLFIKRYTA